jgi:hypothetical protein
MKIRIALGDLAITVTLEDYAETEEIAPLPRRLDASGAPTGYSPQTGDVCCCAPWGSLALFHKPFKHSSRLLRLGCMNGGVALLRTPGRVEARLEAVPDATR